MAAVGFGEGLEPVHPGPLVTPLGAVRQGPGDDAPQGVPLIVGDLVEGVGGGLQVTAEVVVLQGAFTPAP